MTDQDQPLVYLDHAASSPMRPEVRAAMAPFSGARFGNPSGVHRAAHRARRSLEEAREVVAALLGARPGEVVFTSGGTEAANLAILGTLAARRADDQLAGAVVCSAVEHAAVLETCRAARSTDLRFGSAVCVREAPVDARGLVDLEALESLVDGDVALCR
jgi:cysteine desulfurase